MSAFPPATVLTSPSQQAVIEQIRQQIACWALHSKLNSVTSVPCCLTSSLPASLGPALLSLPRTPGPAFELLPASQDVLNPPPCCLCPSLHTAVTSASRWKANCVPALKDLQGSSFYNLCRNLILTSHNSLREESLLFMKSQFLSVAMNMELLLFSTSLSYT